MAILKYTKRGQSGSKDVERLAYNHLTSTGCYSGQSEQTREIAETTAGCVAELIAALADRGLLDASVVVSLIGVSTYDKTDVSIVTEHDLDVQSKKE